MSRKPMFLRTRTARIFLLSYLIVMLLPMTIVPAYYYPMSRKMLINDAADQSMTAMVHLGDLMDSELSNITNMPSYIAGNPQIIEYEILNSPLGIRKAKEQLTQMIRTNTFIEHLFLYMRESQYMLSARTGSFYYTDIRDTPALYQLSFGSISATELQNMLNTVKYPTVLTAENVMIYGVQHEKMLMFAMPVPPSKRAYGTALICIPASKLNAIIPYDDMDASGNVLFFDDSGSLVHAASPLTEEMRQAIPTFLATADKAIGMRYIDVENQSHMVTWVTSAKYGWQYVNVLPVSAVTQEVNQLQRTTMLLIGGVSAISMLMIWYAMKINYLPIQQLVQIAKETVPASSEGPMVNDFDAIHSLIDSLKTKALTLDERITESEPQLRHFLIEKLLYGDAKDSASVVRQAEQIGVDLTQGPYRAAIVDYMNAPAADNALICLMERCNNGTNAFIVVQGDEPEHLNLILTGEWADHAAILNNLQPCRRVALGDPVQTPDQLSVSFHHASSVMDYMRLHDICDQAMSYDELPDRVFRPRSYPLDVMQSLDLAIQHNDGSRVLSLVDQIIMLLMVDGSPPYYTRSVYLNAVSLLVAGLTRMTGGSDTVTEIGTRSILGQYTVSRMTEILRNTAQQMALMMEQITRKESSVSNLLQLIESQIGHPTLSLQSIADELGMSSSAFSRMFKEKTGRNFKDYVDGLRIAKAKELLAETNLPVDKIALEVGYEVPTSFYRLFKKYVGVAPGEYRQAQTAQ